TVADLMAAGEFVRVVEERQGLKIGCIEEIAWRNGFIDDARLAEIAEPLRRSGYGDYLISLLDQGDRDAG
ncbi:MAG TPA: glucose-1-phosphate thymidylyltransferase, partial [Candidatus Nanopelagicales bacterium]|nr:glucose-1-phosphate thymidylyltransferase [Candidatus Nanopelagicales bacterium]